MARRLYYREEKEEDDISIYSQTAREEMLEDDEIAPEEEAFMAGYESAA